jgi:hypothetical protein
MLGEFFSTLIKNANIKSEKPGKSWMYPDMPLCVPSTELVHVDRNVDVLLTVKVTLSKNWEKPIGET